MFITFEGIDYSGKSTQAALAARRLEAAGLRVTFVREPGGTELAERIRAILLDRSDLSIDPVSELLLFNAARAQLVREVIAPALREGAVVVCDRFYDSTTAYQGYGRDLPVDRVMEVNAFAAAGAVPDLTLFVDVEPKEIARRRAAIGSDPDRMERSGDRFYEKVAAGYREIARREPGRVVIVAGNGSIETTHETVWTHIAMRLKVKGVTR